MGLKVRVASVRKRDTTQRRSSAEVQGRKPTVMVGMLRKCCACQASSVTCNATPFLSLVDSLMFSLVSWNYQPLPKYCVQQQKSYVRKKKVFAQKRVPRQARRVSWSPESNPATPQDWEGLGKDRRATISLFCRFCDPNAAANRPRDPAFRSSRFSRSALDRRWSRT